MHPPERESPLASLTEYAAEAGGGDGWLVLRPGRASFLVGCLEALASGSALGRFDREAATADRHGLMATLAPAALRT
jgi:hypothetical protein